MSSTQALVERTFEVAGTGEHSRHLSAIANRLVDLSFYGILTSIVILGAVGGSVDGPSRSLLALLLLLCTIARLTGSIISGSFRISEPILLLPLAGVLGLAILQILPLGPGSLLSSEDPFETKSFIVLFLALLAAGETLCGLVKPPHRLRFLVIVIIGVGVLSAAYGIAHSAILGPSEEFAQFANRNHFAFLAEMSVGLLLGWLIKGRLAKGKLLICLISAAIIIYAIFTAGSRGGVVSLVSMGLFAVLLNTFFTRGPARTRGSSLRPKWFGWRRVLGAAAVCVLVLAASTAALLFLGGDKVVSRFELLPDEVEQRADLRLNRGTIWNITVDLIKERPVTGAGFGAYAVAITRFDGSNGLWEAEQAHNEYLEILANGGVVAGLLFAIFGIMVAKRAISGLKSGERLVRSSCFGAAVAIFGVLIHSLVDFGLHVPINALLFVALIVIVTRQSTTSDEQE